METPPEHRTVLLDEAVEALTTRLDGRYVDGTFGRGGHTRLLLSRLGPAAQVLVVDKDPRAIAVADALALEDSRVVVQRGGFVALGDYLDGRGWDQVDGVLLDLGVSSPQLDDAARGFSFMREGPLDMRMDPDKGESAAEWLARADAESIAQVLWQFGEERFSRRIARRVVETRVESPLRTTLQLARLVEDAVPIREKGKHPATRTFQAIRIHVNQELAELERVLGVASQRLRLGGRLVVISFHSLEDRIVKRFMRDQARGPQLPRGLPVQVHSMGAGFRLVGKPVMPSEQEVAANVRARSAVMRVLERCAG
ncbi:MAG: 16S rRNA (cytosine(1402)-N(4))-methyltransferase RsmH [Pseudomonadaceae bacterium]|nr:16S rRNA (cytosine(1402)-N(4))-methyltransferase RsmH [Pseudomonadaceae bacterium]